MRAGSGQRCLASAATPADGVDGVERLTPKGDEMGREEVSRANERASRTNQGIEWELKGRRRWAKG